MDATTMRGLLEELIDEAACDLRSALFGEFNGAETISFRLEGLLTCSEGLVLRMPSGEEFQITVVRSR